MRGKGLAQILWNVSPVTDYCEVLRSPGAQRLECVELAPAFGTATLNESASPSSVAVLRRVDELDALQTLRVTAMSTFLYVSIARAAQTKNYPGRTVAGFACVVHPAEARGVNEIQLAGAQIY
jgi:hypothetical protein